MPIYANATRRVQTFNLIRVLPGAAGKTLVFKFFDVGDAASSGTLTVLPPTDATGRLDHELHGHRLQDRHRCRPARSRHQTRHGWNGKSETIAVPIPSNYTCDYTSPGGCWFRVRVTFAGGTVNDTTTWTAYVIGDPVRLIE